nr:succinate dehydrogenase cytochrome b subunit, mitochondrial [Quercus suber]
MDPQALDILHHHQSQYITKLTTPVFLAVAVQQPAYQFAVPALATAALSQQRSAVVQRRYAAAQSVSQEQASSEILAAQRRHRPVAPHLSVYKPQVTWILSSLNRITGVALSGGFYLFGAAYLVAPYLGWHLETAVLAAAFAKWPLFAKVGVKSLVALPFTFHSFNGLRHLTWDTASMISTCYVIRGSSAFNDSELGILLI